MTFSTAVYIEAPPAMVFDALSNLEEAKEWMPNFVSIEMLTPGPVGAGTEWLETRRMYGKQSTEHFRVTRWQPPSRLDIRVDGMRGTTGRGEYLFTFELMPERGGTNVELAADIRMGGVWDVIGRLFLGSFKRASHRDLEALKTHLESRSLAGRGSRF
jgi:carbon monoxide dehydrogenase subunit G